MASKAAQHILAYFSGTRGAPSCQQAFWHSHAAVSENPPATPAWKPLVLNKDKLHVQISTLVTEALEPVVAGMGGEKGLFEGIVACNVPSPLFMFAS